jgi:hypothetical protein
MKFVFGAPPEAALQLANATRFNFDYIKVHLQASALGVFLLGPFAAACWHFLYPHLALSSIFAIGPGQFFTILVLTLVLHECAHVMLFPGMGRGEQAIAGFDPKSALPYVSYLGAVPRIRYIAILLTPLFTLTILPMGLASLFPEFSTWLIGISVLNCAGSAGDLYMVAVIRRATTRDSYIQGEAYGQLAADRAGGKFALNAEQSSAPSPSPKRYALIMLGYVMVLLVATAGGFVAAKLGF